MKLTKALLFDTKNKHEEEFDISHAERILKHDNSWILIDERYEFVNNGIRVNTNKGNIKKPAKKELNSKSNKASK